MSQQNAKQKPGTQLAPSAPPVLGRDGRVTRVGNVLYLPDAQYQRLESLSERAWRSGVLPKHVDSKDKAFIIGLKGLALGLDALYAMEHMSVINGKASIDGQAMLALIYASGGVQVSFPEVPNPAESCRVKMARKGAELEVLWTIDRAKRAGLLSNPSWQKYPDQMLRWRAISECARIIAPDIIGGLYLHEELGAKVDSEGQVIEGEFTVAATSSESVAPQPVSSQEPSPTSQEGSPKTASPAPNVTAQAVGRNEKSDDDPGEFVVNVGKAYVGKRLREVPLSEIVRICGYLHDQKKQGKPLSDQGADFLLHAEHFLEEASIAERPGHEPDVKLPFEEGAQP